MFRTRSFLFLVAVMATSDLHAQHHRGSGHHQRASHYGSNWGHSNWSYVVPGHGYYGQHHRGTYYVDAGRYYYTPTQVVYSPMENVAAAPPQSPVQLEFGGFAYWDDLTGRFETEANNFCLDLHYNYSQNPGFQEMYREAYQILQSAKYIHAAEHQNDRAEITRRITEIDRQFHHVQEEVGGFQRRQQRQIGDGVIAMKSQSMEAVLHHLAYIAGVTPHSTQSQSTIDSVGREEAPPPPDGSPGIPM